MVNAMMMVPHSSWKCERYEPKSKKAVIEKEKKKNGKCRYCRRSHPHPTSDDALDKGWGYLELTTHGKRKGKPIAVDVAFAICPAHHQNLREEIAMGDPTVFAGPPLKFGVTPFDKDPNEEEEK